MIDMKRTLFLSFMAMFMPLCLIGQELDANVKARKTVYMSYILHGNMNYDRYVKTKIWEEFPVIYENLLDFMDEHPDFKGQLQFSGQTLGSLQKAAPQVLEHAMNIHKRGQINFTGTFYSEPVNVNMDGETNYRCARLGTRIVEDFLGEDTDGFYLQERAYHPQLPWILDKSNVSWTPVITGDDSWRPFRLEGQDGSVTVCVPITPKHGVDKAAKAPANSLITIEEDYEIPQKFSRAYAAVEAFNKTSEDVEIVWITVKEYIEKFGTDTLKYVDHSAKVRHLENGTYSRWTADPLDIIIQEKTNKAMADFRSAVTFDALLKHCHGVSADRNVKDCDLTLRQSPLAWNIERADLYPDVEPQHLARGEQVTALSRAEHLLLWAVNSDSKGWFPLYEKRVERITSLENSSALSVSILDDDLKEIASRVRVKGYDRYFIVANVEQARRKTISLNCDRAYSIYDYSSGREIESSCVRTDKGYDIVFEADLPAYGYTTLGAKLRGEADVIMWEEGCSIIKDGITVAAEGNKIVVQENGFRSELEMAPFMIKALADVYKGENDDKWRNAVQYGPTRVLRRGNSELVVDRQIDWLLHMRQKFEIKDGRVICDISFTAPHPVNIRQLGGEAKDFDPRGLDLKITTGRSCRTVFDIPFGMTEFTQGGVGHFCPLSTCIMETHQGGLVVAPQSGEQGFTVDADKGEMILYLGASTASGPIKDVNMTFRTPVNVYHEPAWYLEPFHGEYEHRIVLDTYKGTWQSNNVPLRLRERSSPVYLAEFDGKSKVKIKDVLPAAASLVDYDRSDVDITSIENRDGKTVVRMNERVGKEDVFELRIGDVSKEVTIRPFGIVEVEF